MNSFEIVKEAGRYYTERYMEHRDGYLAADWNSEKAQSIRFEQLSRMLPENRDEGFSLCDYGSGLGDYQKYLSAKYANALYTGIDVSSEIVEKARQIHSDGQYICDSSVRSTYDYIVASGVFNVRQKTTDNDWKDYILSTIKMFFEHSREGFAFNCLTSYSDEEKKQDYLYYADPLYLFDFCKRNFSRNVALLHDYDIYDFTIIVRKDNTLH